MNATIRIRVNSAAPVDAIGEFCSLTAAVDAALAYERRRLPNQPSAWYEVRVDSLWVHARLVGNRLVVDQAALAPAVFCA